MLGLLWVTVDMSLRGILQAAPAVIASPILVLVS